MAEPRRPLKRPEPGQVGRKDSPGDYTGPSADGRFFVINLWFMKLGSDDKLQGAALFLSVLFIALLCAVIVFGFWGDPEWASRVLTVIVTPLMLVIGVAVGRSASTKDEDGKN